MKTRRFLLTVLLVLLVASVSVPLVMGAAPSRSDVKDPPDGFIVFEGPNAGNVLSRAARFADACDCEVYYGQLVQLRVEITRLYLEYHTVTIPPTTTEDSFR